MPPPVERSLPPSPQPQLICQRGTAAAAAFTSSSASASAVPTAAAASKEDDDVSRAVDVAYISRKAGRGENGTLMSAHSAVLDASFDISLSIFGRYLFEYSPRQRSGVFCFIQAFCNSLYITVQDSVSIEELNVTAGVSKEVQCVSEAQLSPSPE